MAPWAKAPSPKGGSRRPPRRPASELRVVPPPEVRNGFEVSIAYLDRAHGPRSPITAPASSRPAAALRCTPRPHPRRPRGLTPPTHIMPILRVMRPGVARSTSRVVPRSPSRRVRARSVPPRRASWRPPRHRPRVTARASARQRARRRTRAMSSSATATTRASSTKNGVDVSSHGPPARMDRGHRGRAMALARSRHVALALFALFLLFRPRLGSSSDDAGTKGATTRDSSRGGRRRATRRRRSKSRARGRADPSRRAPDV